MAGTSLITAPGRLVVLRQPAPGQYELDDPAREAELDKPLILSENGRNIYCRVVSLEIRGGRCFALVQASANDRNKERAARAWRALPLYRPEDIGLEEAITDLMTDLLHLTHQRNFSPEAMVRRCVMHFEEESGVKLER